MIASSIVGIVMERDGKVQDFILTREPITITSVRSYMSEKNGKVGVVKIKSFSGTTASTVQEALESLKKKGAEAIVLDVRGNPGGLLPGGVDTAALFLEANKPLVFVVDKKGVQVRSFGNITNSIHFDSVRFSTIVFSGQSVHLPGWNGRRHSFSCVS